MKAEALSKMSQIVARINAKQNRHKKNLMLVRKNFRSTGAY